MRGTLAPAPTLGAMSAIEEYPLPPGVDGLAAAWRACERIERGTGPALALVPPSDGTVATTRVRNAMHLNDPDFDDELNEIAAIIATSGSTGRPRGVMFTADAFLALLDGPDRQWIAALPLTSIGGFNVVLRGWRQDRMPTALPSIGGAGPFRAADVTAAIRSARDATPAISLVPTQLAACLADPDTTRALADCDPVLVGGAALPAALAQGAADAGITITRTYGSTETRGGCVHNGKPLPGVGIEITDDQRIAISGPMLARGYRADPEATRMYFANGLFTSQDLGELSSAGELRVLGRVDDVITVTGVNVALGAIEGVVQVMPSVRECAATVTDRDQHTPSVNLWVVPMSETAGVDGDAIRDAVRLELGPAAVPKQITVTSEFPLLPGGKVDKQALERRGHDH
jgi:O-succinylbenzoic acid--CoA ligase